VTKLSKFNINQKQYILRKRTAKSEDILYIRQTTVRRWTFFRHLILLGLNFSFKLLATCDWCPILLYTIAKHDRETSHLNSATRWMVESHHGNTDLDSNHLFKLNFL